MIDCVFKVTNILIMSWVIGLEILQVVSEQFYVSFWVVIGQIKDNLSHTTQCGQHSPKKEIQLLLILIQSCKKCMFYIYILYFFIFLYSKHYQIKQSSLKNTWINHRDGPNYSHPRLRSFPKWSSLTFENSNTVI